jgi:hypothetical protein
LSFTTILASGASKFDRFEDPALKIISREGLAALAAFLAAVAAFLAAALSKTSYFCVSLLT